MSGRVFQPQTIKVLSTIRAYSRKYAVIFQKKAKNEQNILKRAKNGEVFEDLGKSTQNLKIFCKMAGDNV